MPHRKDSSIGTLIDIRRCDERSETNLAWLRGRHWFWVGDQPYDPANTHHGLLLLHNENTIRPGTGFETHPHRDMEIVTWVIEGALVHQDSVGNSGIDASDTGDLPAISSGGRVALREVYFHYPGTSQDALAGVSFQADPASSWRWSGRAGPARPPSAT